MSLVDALRKQFAYDAWANKEVLNAIGDGRVASGRALQLLAHILSAERLWLERIKQQPQSMAVWPEATAGQCEAQAFEMQRLWAEFFDSLSADDLARTASYKNSKGELWTSTVEDVLTHVILHSAYHRGQIASHMRESGEAPAYTDYIHAVRQGLVK
ncbi:MAG TPA: DinB family protein [Candidatus Solibacter sp.]|nr:DinB family protein [Candidatus Solibacter sp.]